MPATLTDGSEQTIINMAEDSAELFELEVSLPDTHLSEQAKRLVGFSARYGRIHQDLRLLIDKDGLQKWSKQQYGRRVALLDSLIDRYPLVIFHGEDRKSVV